MGKAGSTRAKVIPAVLDSRLGRGGPNPFIDPAGYARELDLTEAMFQAVLAAQQRLAGK